MAPTDLSRLQMDLSHVDTRLRHVEQLARAGNQKPASMQDVGDLARYVRELVKVVQGLASAVVPESD
jgi:hypothetical protein